MWRLQAGFDAQQSTVALAPADRPGRVAVGDERAVRALPQRVAPDGCQGGLVVVAAGQELLAQDLQRA